MSDVTLRYRVEEGEEWWHVLDGEAGPWSEIVDRHPTEDAALASCRRFNEGTHNLVREVRLSPDEWLRVLHLMRAVGVFIETCACETLADPELRPAIDAYDATAALRARMGWR